MWRNKSLILIIFLLIGLTQAQAQINRYMVFFNAKDTAAFDSSSPSDYLSQRAIDRRSRQEIPVTIEDFPVTESYIEELESQGVEVYFQSKWFNGVLVQMNESKWLEINGLNFVNNIEFIAPGSLLQPTHDSFDIPESFMEPPSVSDNSNLQLKLLDADIMHEDGYQGEGMMIAVLDNGFSGVNKYSPFQHLFDDDRLVGARDFTHNSRNVFQFGSHGTQVLSCIGARYGDDMIGTAPNASYVLCVTEASKEYRIEEYNWLLAAEYADSMGVDVINCSLGYSTFDTTSMDYKFSDMDGKTTVITRAANKAFDKGIVVVSSAGNDGNRPWQKVTAPADSEKVLTIGSIDRDRSKTSFSAFGPTADGRIKPDVCALGNPTTVVKSNGAISTNTGTSFSSPLIAGFAACIWQANPNWSNQKVVDAIRNSGSKSLAPDTAVGYGVPNYTVAVSGSSLSIDYLVENDIKVFPNPFRENKVTLDLRNSHIQMPFKIEVFNMEGRLIYEDRITERHKQDLIDVNFDASEEGVYLLHIESKKIQKTIKLVKI